MKKESKQSETQSEPEAPALDSTKPLEPKSKRALAIIPPHSTFSGKLTSEEAEAIKRARTS